MTDTNLTFTRVMQSVVPIKDALAEEFFSQFRPVELAADEYFVKHGQVCSRVAFIETGMIRHYYLEDGADITRWMSLENEFVTALGSFIREQPCTHYLQAVMPCRLWTIQKSEWLEQYRRHEILREFWARMMEINVIGFEDRMYQQIAGSAEQRYLYFMQQYPGFLEKVPQKYIASMIGIKPESLSRLRAKLARKRRT